MGAGLTVDIDALLSSSMQLQDTKDFLYDVASGTVAELATAAGMAGDDAAGHRFAASYEPAAHIVLGGIGRSGEGVWSAAHRLMTAAKNYVITDDAGAAALMGKMTPAPAHVAGGVPAEECEPSTAGSSLPEVTGERQSISIPIVGDMWPAGDPDKLCRAASAWMQAAELIDRAQVNAGMHTRQLSGAWSGGAYDAFREYEATLYTAYPSGGKVPATSGPFMEDVSGACRALAEACTGYARAIDDCRSKILKIGAGAGVIAAAGVGLTIFTLGGSDVVAAGGEAAMVAEASAAVATMEVAMSDAVAVSAIAEAEAVVASAASRILIGAGATVAVSAIATFTGAEGAEAAGDSPMALGGGIPYASIPAVGPVIAPIPAPVPAPFGVFTPAQAAAARTWAAGLPTRDPVYGKVEDQAYQLRTAGAPERLMSSRDGATTQWADGYRAQDGAVIDAKNVRNPQCSPRTLDKLSEEDLPPWDESVVDGDGKELGKYAQVVANPQNHARYLEIDTNNPDSVEYWQVLSTEQGVPSNVRYIP